jgi:hypothetical protein
MTQIKPNDEYDDVDRIVPAIRDCQAIIQLHASGIIYVYSSM